MASPDRDNGARSAGLGGGIQLAKAAGVQRRYLSDIERGKVNPSIQIQDQIATALGIPLAELIAEAEREREQNRRRQQDDA